jgi:spermidine/putrescine transport system ATP-binding protein
VSAPAVQFEHVSKTFGSFRAVRDVSFDIQPGEFYSLLGPSGCGKTTNLRLLAGFEEPDEDGGKVRVSGEVVNHKRPYDRNLGMVFQSYALFPHLTIERNIAFGLEQRGVKGAEIGERVKAAMDMVRLDVATFARRVPGQLSGGQRQRVALARALVIRPPILLLDEPLGALDLKLRKEMQFELKALNRRLGITFVYVTHDQEEALTMSDRIAVMDNARIAQLGTPAEIYERPKTRFVARFIGESNFLEGRPVLEQGEAVVVEREGGGRFRVRTPVPPGDRVVVALRPERTELRPAADAGINALPGVVEAVVYRGETLHVKVKLAGGGEMLAAARNEGQLRRPVPWRAGDEVAVAWAPEDGVAVEEDAR